MNTLLATNPLLRLLACEASPGSGAAAPITRSGPLPEALDDATLAYVAAMRETFDQLRQVAGQLAGVLVLAVASGQGVAGHPMLELADTVLGTAADAVRGCRPPPRGAHHHRHLARALEQFGLALTAARLNLRAGDEAATDAIMTPLRAGFSELQSAANVLPGFEVVAFSQGCCARHAGPPLPVLIHPNI